MKAMILAAGFGTRLFPLTADRPKPAIPVLNRPLIGYSIEYLKQWGVSDFVVNLHYKGESIQAALGDGRRWDCRIAYSHEEDLILGTSGALDHARRLLPNETFIVMNGKVVTSVNLAEALETHRARRALATLILKPNPGGERFSVVEVDGDGHIQRFGGFPAPDAASDALMFTGIQILEPEIFDYIPRGVFSHSTTDVYPKAIADGRPVVAHVARGAHEHWHEFSTLERYLNLNFILLGTGPLSVILGAGCLLADDVALDRTILWDRVAVGAGATLHDVIVGDDVAIPSGARLVRAAVVRADKVAPAELAAKLADGCARVDGENLIIPF
jgi:NDP-sugar pyrophosphorylase family protein